jgi:transcriptional regulator with XRE-family HTH domain
MIAAQAARVLSCNLRFQRSADGKTQKEMASHCGLSFRLYQNLEAGKGNPTLESLDRIARAAKMPVAELFKLKGLQIQGTKEEFLQALASRFKDSRLGAGVRTHEGMALWANRRALALHGQSLEQGPMNLTNYQTGVGLEILKNQLESERRNQVQTYVNVAPIAGGESRVIRYYPTNVYPRRGTVPHFTAVYMAPVGEDTEANYLEFCEQLLTCV